LNEEQPIDTVQISNHYPSFYFW